MELWEFSGDHIGTIHEHVAVSLFTFKIKLSLWATWTSSFMSLASPPSSHVTDSENSDLFIAGNVWHILSLDGSDGVLSVPVCVAFMALSSGSSDVSLLFIYFLINKRVSHIAWLYVVPITGMEQWVEAPGRFAEKLLINFLFIKLYLLTYPTFHMRRLLLPRQFCVVPSVTYPSLRVL